MPKRIKAQNEVRVSEEFTDILTKSIHLMTQRPRSHLHSA